jgi:hypothetical protein
VLTFSNSKGWYWANYSTKIHPLNLDAIGSTHVTSYSVRVKFTDISDGLAWLQIYSGKGPLMDTIVCDTVAIYTDINNKKAVIAIKNNET